MHYVNLGDRAATRLVNLLKKHVGECMPALRGFFSSRTLVVALTILLLIGASSQLLPIIFSLAHTPGAVALGLADGKAENGPIGQQQPAIEGWVKDAATDADLNSGIVSLSDSVSAPLGKGGYFSFSTSQLSH